MASVYFPPSAGGDGSTVTDDANPLTGLANGGHRTRFVPALAQVVAVGGFVVTKAGEAATSASNASTSASNAAASAASAAASWDSFDDRYLGPKASDPTLDNDSNALQEGAIYWNTTSQQMRVWNGSAWIAGTFVPTAASSVTCTPVNGVTATNVQAAIAQLSASPSANLFAFENLGGF